MAVRIANAETIEQLDVRVAALEKAVLALAEHVNEVSHNIAEIAEQLGLKLTSRHE